MCGKSVRVSGKQVKSLPNKCGLTINATTKEAQMKESARVINLAFANAKKVIGNKPVMAIAA